MTNKLVRNFIAPSKEWADGIKQTHNIRALQVKEKVIAERLELEREYPILNKYEVLELKRKKIIIQARISQLVTHNFNRIAKEVLDNVN